MTSVEIHVEDLIPHRGAMLLVERVIEISEDCENIFAQCTVTEAWPTGSNGNVRALMLLELIAQSAGVLIGWRERQQGTGRGQGLLVGFRRASTGPALIAIGTELLCHAQLDRAIGQFAAFRGTVTDNQGVKLAEAELQAFRP